MNRSEAFALWGMVLFVVVKTTAILAAVWVIANVNWGVGMLLFALACMYRLIWVFDRETDKLRQIKELVECWDEDEEAPYRENILRIING